MDQKDTEFWNMLADMPRRNAPEGFSATVMARIASEVQLAPVVKKDSRVKWVSWGGIAAALIGVVGFMSQMMAPESIQDDAVIASVDDQVLLDSAYESLGYESLQDAVCSVSSPDMDNLGEADFASMIL